MIVRIVNYKEDRDRFFDCRNTCIVPELYPATDDEPKGGKVRYFLVIEFGSSDITIQLSSGDELYYMNDNGKTINTDLRMKYRD